MTKQEFLDKLRMALNGKISGAAVTENLQYYEDYINTEIRKGRTEAEVLEMLGDPRLIARTIVTAGTNGREQEGSFRNADTVNGGSRTYEYEQEQESGHRKYPRRRIAVPAWVWLIIGIIIVVLVISAVFSVLSFLLPVLIPIAVVLLLVKLFRDWMN